MGSLGELEAKACKYRYSILFPLSGPLSLYLPFAPPDKVIPRLHLDFHLNPRAGGPTPMHNRAACAFPLSFLRKGGIFGRNLGMRKPEGGVFWGELPTVTNTRDMGYILGYNYFPRDMGGGGFRWWGMGTYAFYGAAESTRPAWRARKAIFT